MNLNVFEAESIVMILIHFAALALAIFAFVNSLLYTKEAYDAAGKLTKPTWCTILGIGVVLQFVGIPLPLVGLIALIAALVYLADVRPALSSLYRR